MEKTERNVIGDREINKYLNFIDRIFDINQRNDVVAERLRKNGYVKHRKSDIEKRIQINDEENFFAPNIMYDAYQGRYIGKREGDFYHTKDKNDVKSYILPKFYKCKEIKEISEKIAIQVNKNKSEHYTDIQAFKNLSRYEAKTLIQTLCVALVAINRIKNYVEGGHIKGVEKDPDENYCDYSKVELLKFKDDILKKILQYVVVYNDEYRLNKISYGWSVDELENMNIDSFVINIPEYSQIAVHVKGVKDEIIRESKAKVKYSKINIKDSEFEKKYNMKLYETNIGGLPHRCISAYELKSRIGETERETISPLIDRLAKISNLSQAQDIVKLFTEYSFSRGIDKFEISDGFDSEFAKKINKKYNEKVGFSEKEIFYLANGLGCSEKQLEMIHEAFLLEKNNIKSEDIKKHIINNINNKNYENCVENTMKLIGEDIVDEDKEWIRSAVERVKYETILQNVDKESPLKFIRSLENLKVNNTNIIINCRKEYRKIAEILGFNKRDNFYINNVNYLIDCVDGKIKNENLYNTIYTINLAKRLVDNEVTREQLLNNMCGEDVRNDIEYFINNGVDISDFSKLDKELKENKENVKYYIDEILSNVNKDAKENIHADIDKYIAQRDEKIIKNNLLKYSMKLKLDTPERYKKIDVLADEIVKNTSIYNEDMKAKLYSEMKQKAVEEISKKCQINSEESNINNTLNLVNLINNISEKYKNITDKEIEFLADENEKNINELLMLKNNNKNKKIELPLSDIEKIYKENYNKKSWQFNKIIKKYYKYNKNNKVISTPEEIKKINIGVNKLIKASVDKIVLDNEFSNNNINDYIEADKMIKKLKKYEISYKIYDKEENEKNKSTIVSYNANDIINSLGKGENISEECYKLLREVPILKNQLKTMIACDEKTKFKNTEFEDYAIYLEENLSEKDIKSINKISNIIEECVLSGVDIDTLDNLDKMVNNIKEQCKDIEWLDTNILRKSLCELYELEKLDSNMVGLNALNNTTVWDRINARKEEEFVKERVDIKIK